MSMFCYQCQQTAQGTGCTTGGVCGKDVRTAQLQDLLTAWCKQIALTRRQMREKAKPVESRVLDRFLLESLFSTLTNVNFDTVEIARKIFLADRMLQLAEYLAGDCDADGQASLERQVLEPIPDPDETQIADFIEQAQGCSISLRREELGAAATGLQELILYGIRGTAAYSWHLTELEPEACEAVELTIKGMKSRIKELKPRDSKDREIKERLLKDIKTMESDVADWESRKQELLDGLFSELAALLDESTDTDALLASALKIGELNLRAMELLEKSHISLFGTPEPSAVRTTPVAGKCILVSGHDLGDLAELLRQTEGKGVNVYTHGEMLPAHSYPVLKKFKHLAGHYGTAWQNQQKEFDAFPGAILMTTNCLMKPQESYFDYIFTTGPVGWPGVKRIPVHHGKKDFSLLIQAALDSPGYFKTKPVEKVTVGFGADAIRNMSDQVFRAIQKGNLRRFFLIGGCDGAQTKRSYFTELAEAVPDDCVILTLGCGKYRLNSLEFAPLANALPRLWDMGQCNDAYSAIRLLSFFAKQFNCGVNELPVSIFLSWFEQKAVSVLLTLLYLDIRNIRLGPSLPAFLEPEVVAVLQEKFGIAPVSDNPKADLDAALAAN